MKKIAFGAKRPSASGDGRQLDAWILGSQPTTQEPMKRLTIDVSLSLHQRIKIQCAQERLVIANEIRLLLEQRFPVRGGQGGEQGGAS